ncbi:nicotinate-nucleotide--dimethylbenzimidazole phosphoribosyltransferase [Sporomusaceae bacterium BoRhaA]|uniref:nicotinate-nucleotide--dimethylbenzimidazole phosphoribosyltransferase n=1 Tax=Pelorhabdus rhamnosifermentans TaxID=2772457 RepID=UPI001C0645A1|nr:nicotinate-nucleotide--dimethylbenzimidazole phosphoribosyltransferase [Pelorhabdus rhamnosifermentans]MBU2700865.1 nicotinate-nucleotide--dimethylbenzimidazole phosphoribosyltransferase [Pelorhabdus rhamnosifermentans]
MLDQVITSIKPLDEEAMEKCQLRLDNLTKPLGSLHSFEHLAKKLAGITGTPRPHDLKKSIIIMAGDHGITEAIPPDLRESTVQRINDCCTGRAAIKVFADHAAAKWGVVDVGVAADLPTSQFVYHEKIAYGTKNILKQAAMTRIQTVQAIEVGIKIAQIERRQGTHIFGLGDIGRANNLSGMALVACYSEKPLSDLVNSNTAINLSGNRQIELLKTALTVNCPDKQDALDVLSKVGGFEIAGLVGVILGAAAGGAAVVLDGLVTSAAALIAVQLAPTVQEYLIGSQFAMEPAHQEALECLHIPAYLQLQMNLGEGTGAALGMSLINASLHVLNDMKTFGTAQVAVAQDGPGALKQDKNVKD